MKWTAPTIAALALAACTVCALWWLMRHNTEPSSVVIATPAPQVATVPTVTIQPAQVRVLAPSAKRKLALPAAVQADAQQHVAAATRVDPGIRPVTVTSVLDADTGEITTYTREEPLPWLATTRRGEIGLAYGLRSGQQTGRLYLHQGLVDLKTLRLNGIAHLDQDGQWFAGVALAYRY